MVVEDFPGQLGLTTPGVKALEIPPKYQENELLSNEDFKVELEILGTKIMWSKQQELGKNLEEDPEPLTEEQEEELKITEV